MSEYGLDMAAVLGNKELVATKRRGNFRYWKPKAGDNRIRILPPASAEIAGSGLISAVKAFNHWNVGPDDRKFPCPKLTLEQPCAICDHRSKLTLSASAEDQKYAEEIKPKKCYYLNIVALDDPVFTDEDFAEASEEDNASFDVGDTKVQILTAGTTIYSAIHKMAVSLNEDVTSLKTGRNFVVNRVGKGFDTKYAVWNEDKSSFKFEGDINSQLYDLNIFIKPKPPEDIAAALGVEILEALPAQAQGALPPSRPAVVAENVETDIPSCFKDATVFSSTDVECVGGIADDGEVLSQCDVYTECGTACGVLKPKARRRRKKKTNGNTAATAPTTAQLSDVEQLEQEMREALNK